MQFSPLELLQTNPKTPGTTNQPSDTVPSGSFDAVLSNCLGSSPDATIDGNRTFQEDGPISHRLVSLITRLKHLFDTYYGTTDCCEFKALLENVLPEDDRLFLSRLIESPGTLDEKLLAADTKTLHNSVLEELIAALGSIIQTAANGQTPDITAQGSALVAQQGPGTDGADMQDAMALLLQLNEKLQAIRTALSDGLQTSAAGGKNESAVNTGEPFSHLLSAPAEADDPATFGTAQKTDTQGQGASLTNVQAPEDLRTFKQTIENILQQRQSLQGLISSGNQGTKQLVNTLIQQQEGRQNSIGQIWLQQQGQNLYTISSHAPAADFYGTTQTMMEKFFQEVEQLHNGSGKTIEQGGIKQTLEMWAGGSEMKEDSTTFQNSGHNTGGKDLVFTLSDMQTLKSQHVQKTGTPEGINPSYLLEQITEKVHLAAGRGRSRVTMQLYPPSLGKLEINLTIKDNNLQAVIVAESAQVKNVLDSNLDQLRASLESQNIEVEKFSVTVGHDQKDNQFASLLKDNHGRSGRGLSETQGTVDQNQAEENERSLIMNRSDIVDLFA